jgi:hypoxanthine phosphoribosyltransferase
MMGRYVLMLNKDVKKVLISEAELDRIVTRLAGEIDRDYAGEDKRLVLICILKGSLVFMGDLMKKLTVPVEIDCMRVSSYGAGTVSSGNVNIIMDIMRTDLHDCDLLIVEDIIDSGRTLNYLTKYLLNKGAKSVKTCTLLDKPSRRLVDFKADISLFTIPDHFVIGYGLDCGEAYRNLPYIAEYRESED